MKRVRAALGSALFLIAAPGVVAGLVPFWVCGWHVSPPLLGFPPLRWLGVPLLAAGLPVLIDSFVRFALQGLGTPAPIAPTQHLVVTGLYRYVRNPMYVAVVALILGQGLLFGSRPVLAYGGAVWAMFHLFVIVYEEPTLRSTFASEYEQFCAHVPRWIPRVSPWSGPSRQPR
jgi:protein-S-isoprenylcysteine O-methyltransferase Ste14